MRPLHITAVVKVLFVAFLLLMLSAALGCKAGEVRKQAEKVAAETRKTIEAKEKVDAALSTVEELPETEQVKAVREALPPEARPGFDAAVAKGRQAIDIAQEVSRALGASAEQLLIQLDRLESDLASAQAEDDATLELITWGLTAAVPVLAPLLAFFGYRRGQTSGAAFVASSVARGRNEDESFDRAFDGDAGKAMKAALNTNPRLAAVVRANKTV